MYIHYIDESGYHDYKKQKEKQFEEPLFLIGGVVISEDNIQEINNKIIDYKKNNFPDFPEDFELHAFELINGREIFEDIPREEREELYEGFFKMISDLDFHIILSCICKKKLVDSGHDWSPLKVGFEIITRWYDRFLSLYKNKGMRIVDDRGKQNEYVREIDKTALKDGIDLPTKTVIKNIVSTAVFEKSKELNHLQLADMVIFNILRKETDALYKKEKHAFFTRIYEKYLAKKRYCIYRYPTY